AGRRGGDPAAGPHAGGARPLHRAWPPRHPAAAPGADPRGRGRAGPAGRGRPGAAACWQPLTLARPPGRVTPPRAPCQQRRPRAVPVPIEPPGPGSRHGWPAQSRGLRPTTIRKPLIG
ncbi:MAG: hypothetical protein FJ296_06105, partial [Planctomycetes bacterium]|nr:hypothetical protein [Planctomycetota bacterium]